MWKISMRNKAKRTGVCFMWQSTCLGNVRPQVQTRVVL
jgi:hypothetical protein